MLITPFTEHDKRLFNIKLPFTIIQDAAFNNVDAIAPCRVIIIKALLSQLYINIVNYKVKKQGLMCQFAIVFLLCTVNVVIAHQQN